MRRRVAISSSLLVVLLIMVLNWERETRFPAEEATSSMEVVDSSIATTPLETTPTSEPFNTEPTSELESVLLPSWRVEGRVLGDGEEGLDAVSVSLSPRTGPIPETNSPRAAVLTDDAGNFELEAAAGEYWLSVQTLGYYGSTKPIVLESDQTLEIPLTRVEGNYYAGTVVDDEGNPRPAASVVARWGAGIHGYNSTFTNSKGEFLLPVDPEQEMRITVSSTGLEDARHLGRLGDLPEWIVLDRGADLRVFIDYPETPGRARSRYELRHLELDFEKRDVYVLTNDGMLIAGLTPGPYEIQISTPGWPRSEPVEFHLERGRETEVRVPMQRLGVGLQVTVTNPAGEPIPEANVEMALLDVLSRTTGKTNAHGVYTDESFARGESLMLRVSAQGFISTFRQIETGGEPIAVMLAHAASARVKVVNPSGAPVPHVKVECWDRLGRDRAGLGVSGRTDEHGEVTFEDLAPGDLEIRVSHEGFSAFARDMLQPGEKKQLELRLEQHSTVSGRILNNETPSAGGTLLLTSVATREKTRAVVDADGRFEAPLRSSALYRIALRKQQNTLLWEEQINLGVYTESNPLVLRYESEVIRGKVLLADGSPARGQRGRLENATATLEFKTDQHGEFELHQAPRGTYDWSFLIPPPGVLAPSQRAEIPSEDPLVFRFRSGRIYSWYVTAADLSVPVGVQLYPSHGAPLRLGLRNSCTVDAAAVWIDVTAEGFAPQRVHLEGREPGERITVALESTSSTAIQVLSDTGLPRLRQEFRIESLTQTLPDWLARGDTGFAGQSDLIWLAPGSYVVSTQIGLETFSQEFQVDGVTPQRVVLP